MRERRVNPEYFAIFSKGKSPSCNIFIATEMITLNMKSSFIYSSSKAFSIIASPLFLLLYYNMCLYFRQALISCSVNVLGTVITANSTLFCNTSIFSSCRLYYSGFICMGNFNVINEWYVADTSRKIKTVFDTDHPRLKAARAEVSELQEMRMCIDIALNAEQPKQAQSHIKRHKQGR